MVKGIVVGVYGDGVELVVIELVVAGSQMAVHSWSSELRGPVAVDTCWVGLALMQCLRPSQNAQVQSNTVVQGSEGMRQGEGAVQQQ